ITQAEHVLPVACGEVEILIFDFARPVRSELVLEAAADNPARLRFAIGEDGRGGANVGDDVAIFHVAISETAGRINESAIEGVTQAAANGAEPIHLRLSISVAVGDTGAFEVGFHAEHDMAPLEVITQFRAAESTRRIEVIGVCAPAIASVSTCIKAAPVNLGVSRAIFVAAAVWRAIHVSSVCGGKGDNARKREAENAGKEFHLSLI